MGNKKERKGSGGKSHHPYHNKLWLAIYVYYCTLPIIRKNINIYGPQLSDEFILYHIQHYIYLF